MTLYSFPMGTLAMIWVFFFHLGGLSEHSLQSLCLVVFWQELDSSAHAEGSGYLERCSQSLHLWLAGAVELESHSSLSLLFPAWLFTVNTHPLVRLACFNIDRVYLFPFKSSVEQQIQLSTLNTALGSWMCSLGKCLADVGVLGYSPVLGFWRHCSICVNVLVKVSVKVFN